MCVALICHSKREATISHRSTSPPSARAAGSGAGPRRVLHRPPDHPHRPGSRSQRGRLTFCGGHTAALVLRHRQ
eukprot:627587-Prymnesium_polylepis.2